MIPKEVGGVVPGVTIVGGGVGVVVVGWIDIGG